jgi:hypothetical protein
MQHAIATALPPYPDPRAFLNTDDEVVEVAITGPVDGPIAVGTELFTWARSQQGASGSLARAV